MQAANMEQLFVFNIMNKTNFSDKESIEQFYENIFKKLYLNIHQESQDFFHIIIAILLVVSIIGSFSNFSIIFVFKFIFDTNFNRRIESALAAVSNCHINCNNSATITQEPIIQIMEDKKNSEIMKLYESYINSKKKLLLNSNFSLFYKLIFYLALIDLFTCSVAIPVTIYEILNDMKINEICCKLFEFIRAFGVISR